MQKRLWFIPALIGIAVFLEACGGQGSTQPTTTPASVTQGMLAQTKTIVNGTVYVTARGSRDTVFQVDPTEMFNVRVTGWFHASGGSKNDIEVFICNDSDFQAWQQGRRINPVYHLAPTTMSNLNVSLPASTQRYHLVFSNTFSSSPKTVQAGITLSYAVKAPTTAPATDNQTGQ